MNEKEMMELLLDKMDSMETKMDRMETRMDSMETKMDRMETRMDCMETRMDNMQSQLGCVQNDVKDIKLTLENEIRVNIQRVAEGHLDLSRNLHEAMQPNNEVEMLAVKVRILETDVKELKRKVL